MNVTCLIGIDGDALERYVYDPYGNVTIYDGSWGSRSTSSYSNSLLYCGYYHDNETGLYHVRNRMYHPKLGRWITRDPIKYADGMNQYQYALSGPVLFVDPEGRSPALIGPIIADQIWQAIISWGVQQTALEALNHTQQPIVRYHTLTPGTVGDENMVLVRVREFNYWSDSKGYFLGLRQFHFRLKKQGVRDEYYACEKEGLRWEGDLSLNKNVGEAHIWKRSGFTIRIQIEGRMTIRWKKGYEPEGPDRKFPTDLPPTPEVGFPPVEDPVK
jgi:RHS repeat-associated protein